MSYYFAPAVYVLCFLTSSICAVMLGRSYRQSRTSLLLWSAGCFFFLALTNLFLVIDSIVLPGTDLAIVRGFLSLAAVATLLFGFIWNGEGE